MDSNVSSLSAFFDLAKAKECTPAQLALAWLHKQGPDVFPIPGTKSSARIVENAGAVAVAAALTEEDIAIIERAVPKPLGNRYSAEGLKLASDRV